MNPNLLAILIFIISILAIAVASIAIQYNNNCETWKAKGPSESRRKNNKTFVILVLVSALLSMIGTMGYMFKASGAGNRMMTSMSGGQNTMMNSMRF